MPGAAARLLRRGGTDGLGLWFAKAASLLWLDGCWVVRRSVNWTPWVACGYARMGRDAIRELRRISMEVLDPGFDI